MKMADSSSDFVSSVKKKKNGNHDRKPLFNCGPVLTSKLKGDLKNVASIRCHQCRKSEKDKGYIFRCKSCTKTGYCYPCMLRWYPDMTMEMFTKRCPFCLGNCNCTHCLRQVIPNVKAKAKFEPNDDQKPQYSIYILNVLLPFLKQLNDEQEKSIESKATGGGESSKQEYKLTFRRRC